MYSDINIHTTCTVTQTYIQHSRQHTHTHTYNMYSDVNIHTTCTSTYTHVQRVRWQTHTKDVGITLHIPSTDVDRDVLDTVDIDPDIVRATESKIKFKPTCDHEGFPTMSLKKLTSCLRSSALIDLLVISVCAETYRRADNWPLNS